MNRDTEKSINRMFLMLFIGLGVMIVISFIGFSADVKWCEEHGGRIIGGECVIPE